MKNRIGVIVFAVVALGLGIALAMVAEIARDPMTAGLSISGIGGVTTWRDAAEFIALGATSLPGRHRDIIVPPTAAPPKQTDGKGCI